MARIFDSHVHVFPDFTQQIPIAGISDMRRKLRGWMKPWTETLHQSQLLLRQLPEVARRGADEIGGLMMLPNLLLESSPGDLTEAMEKAGIQRALLIAHPPTSTNEFILDLCSNHKEWVGAVSIAADVPKPAAHFKTLVKKGAKALKLHPAAIGEPVDSNYYKSLIKAATTEGLPVIVHTGCFHSSVIFKNPDLGDARNFEPWFKDFPKVQIILAHMNMHEPGVAFDLADKYSNLMVETSWQPAEMIGEAARRIGAERILFGTDWPLIGQNIKIGISRVNDCVDSGFLTQDQADLILWKNAEKLFLSSEDLEDAVS